VEGGLTPRARRVVSHYWRDRRKLGRGLLVDPLMRKLTPLLAIVLPLLSGCGMLPGMGGMGGLGGAASPGGYQPSQQSKDMVRSQEKQAYAIADAYDDEAEGKLEKDLQKALKFTLGQDGMAQGMPAPAPASETIKALRGAGIKLRIEPVTNEDGGAVADNYVQLKDSFTERVQQLQGKLASGQASPAEMKEVQRGTKYAMRISNLQMQVLKISTVALTANSAVQTSGLTNMLKIANMVRSRKMMSMDFNDDDWAQVKNVLTREKRKEAVAASTLGMLAALEAVVGKNGDPKALDLIASGTLDAFPLQVDVSDDDAKAYVNNLSQNVADQKDKYESWMRKAYGDAKYERQYTPSIDRMFAQAASATQQKSIGQMQTDTMSGYNADLAKCARGEDPGPGSMVGPAKCKAARGSGGGGSVASAGGPSGGGATSLLAGLVPVAGGGGGAQAPAAGDKASGAMDRASAGVDTAQALAKGDAAGAIQGAAKMFPGDGPIQSSLQGIAALTKGDAKGALMAAVNLAPGGGLLSKGLGAAGQLLKLF